MKRLISLPILFILAFTASSQDIQKSLLWKISGKDMKQASYLFGTMHLQDRRLFNFPDSLYSAIDNCTAFALEINPDSISGTMSAYLTQYLKNMDKSKKIKDMLTKSEFSDLKKRFSKGDEDIDLDKLTLKQAYLLKEKLTRPARHADDMPTFVDAFLYSIARDKNKLITGLENFSDQVNLLEGLSDDFDPHELLQNLEQGKAETEKLVNVYLDKDLKKVQNMTELMPAKMEEVMLTNRNMKMLHSMDSIMKHASLFAAVGAAHLPGAGGLIKLLRSEGYTVEPVICNTYTHGSTYKFHNSMKSWVEVVNKEAGYSVKMPGKPSDVDYTNNIKMKLFYDLMGEQGFYTMHISSPLLLKTEARDSLLKGMTDNFIVRSNGKSVSEKVVSNNGAAGKEFTFTATDKLLYRVQLLVNGTDLYMLMSNSKTERTAATDSFYNSFRLLEKVKVKGVVKDFAEDFIRVKMIGDPSKNVAYSDDSTAIQVSYFSIDDMQGSYYYVGIDKAAAGYVYGEDSTMSEEYATSLKDKGFVGKMKIVTTPQYTANQYEGTISGAWLKANTIFRGNRKYTLFIMYPESKEAEANADDWFQSIELVPFPEVIFSSQLAPDSSFRTMAPVPFRRFISKDYPSYDVKNTNFLSWDSIRSINFNVLTERLNPYTWVSDDSLALVKWLKTYKKEAEELTDLHYIVKDGVSSLSARMANKRSSQHKWLKAVRQGRTRYLLMSTIPWFAKEDKSVMAFFNDFTILKKDTSEVQLNSNAFFSALHSRDSATYESALEAAGSITFNDKEIPVLLKEFLSFFPRDSSWKTASNRILDQLELHSDKLSIQDITNLYVSIPKDRESQKFSILKLLTGVKDSVAAFAKLKQLLLDNPPTEGNDYELKTVLKHKPWLTKTLFPEILNITKDSATCSWVADITMSLIDSGHITIKQVEDKLPMLLENSRLARKKSKEIYEYYTFLDLLSYFKASSAWNEIKEYQFVNDVYMKWKAVHLLLTNNMAPAAKAIDSIAADRGLRPLAYDSLKEHKKLSLFPKRFLAQRYFAESELSMVVSDRDEEEYSTYKFLGERMVKYKGKLQKFYLFELKMNAEDSTSQLGIVGPFSNNPLTFKPLEKDPATGVYKDPLDKKKLDFQVKDYLLGLEEVKVKDED